MLILAVIYLIFYLKICKELDIIDLVKKGGIIMAKNENRVNVTNRCSECGKELRPIEKNKKTHPEKMELKRYCSNCRKHVIAKEKK